MWQSVKIILRRQVGFALYYIDTGYQKLVIVTILTRATDLMRVTCLTQAWKLPDCTCLLRVSNVLPPHI